LSTFSTEKAPKADVDRRDLAAIRQISLMAVAARLSHFFRSGRENCESLETLV
jgi:hypothetical protein